MTNGGLPSCRLAPRNTHPAQALLPRSYGRDRDGRSCERLPFGRWEVSNVILSHLGHGRRNYSNVCISNDEPNSGLLLAPLRKHYRIIQREPTECRSWKRQTMANQRGSSSCWCGMQTVVSAQLFFESGTRVHPWSRSRQAGLRTPSDKLGATAHYSASVRFQCVTTASTCIGLYVRGRQGTNRS